jgi:prepilin peptidase CpaA
LQGDSTAIEAPATPSGRLPYAIAITAGTLPYLMVGAVTGHELTLFS